MWDIAPEFNAMLLFAEHRYFIQTYVAFYCSHICFNSLYLDIMASHCPLGTNPIQ